MRRFFAPPENFNDREIQLSLEESRHLRDVLRLHVGSTVAVFDGAGNEFVCLIETIGRRDENARLRIVEKTEPPAAESKLDLTLAVALLKGEKFDLVIQKAVELGVTRIVPLVTIRADVRIKDEREGQKKLERWQRIALEAAKQSGRAVVPEIKIPADFADFLEHSSGKRMLFAERGGENLNQSLYKNEERLTAVVGAEGGWEDDEIIAARASGFTVVTLGGRILRAETAAITFTALLQHLVGDLK
ncbi:MAG: 16S rRNA (uracil(1498)-N(3))-methyltransferase [Pyrinomonadaceae bacterium]